MGLDCSASVIIGVHLIKKIRLIEKTKYNEDTGESYKKQEEEGFWAIDGTDIEVDTEEKDISQRNRHIGSIK